ncbi:MAG TPA: hypothetical protein ENF20_08565 [Candidatus Marinimicrobia bacterium]|nr:hypothetical protein [Candidatus Neomarinimicrobiota bacterium]
MNKKLGIVAYILTMLLCAYLTFSSGLILYMHALGMKIIVFHPSLPFTEDYTGQFTVIPQIVQFSYLLLTWGFFAKAGWKKIKSKGGF